MKEFISIVLSIWTYGLYAQQYTIEGIKWDSIYIGTPNKINLKGFDCNKLQYQIEPKVSIEKEGCTLNVKPIKPNVNYKLLYLKTKEIL